MNEAEEPGEPDGKGDSKVVAASPGTVWVGHGLRDEAGASRHLRMGGCGGSLKSVRQLVRMGAGNAGANRGVARTEGLSCSDELRPLGGNPGLLYPRTDDRLNGRAQQPFLGRKAK